MKPFCRLCHICRLFLAIGIASLFMLTAVPAMFLSPLPIAYACPSGQHQDPDSPQCLDNSVLCGSASHLSSDGSFCILNDGVSFVNCNQGQHRDSNNPALCVNDGQCDPGNN